jgi:hypothetical protein
MEFNPQPQKRYASRIQGLMRESFKHINSLPHS